MRTFQSCTRHSGDMVYMMVPTNIKFSWYTASLMHALPIIFVRYLMTEMDRIKQCCWTLMRSFVVKVWRHGRAIDNYPCSPPSTSDSASGCLLIVSTVWKWIILSENCNLWTLAFLANIVYNHNIGPQSHSFCNTHVGRATSLRKTDDHRYFRSPDIAAQKSIRPTIDH